MALPPWGSGAADFYASVLHELGRKIVVIVATEQYEEVKAALDARPEMLAQIELQHSVAVQPGQAISFNMPADGLVPQPELGPELPPGIRVDCPNCGLVQWCTPEAPCAFTLIRPAVQGIALVACPCGHGFEVGFE